MRTQRDDALAMLAVRYGWTLLGAPYRWGGDDPSGWDCSGLCVEVLQAAGVFDRRGDSTADGLFRRFPRVEQPRPGCLAFWGTPARITHVELVAEVIGGQAYTIGASGGGPKTQSEADAWRSNAFVKVRPVAGPGARADFMGYADPFEAVA